MLDIGSVINQMLILLLLLVVGYTAGKLGVIDETAVKKLSKLSLTICQSAMILGSVMNIEHEVSALYVLELLGISCVLYAILLLIAQAVPFVLAAKPRDRGVYRFMATFGNVGFMGFPVVASMFGSEYVFYASIFNIPFNLLIYSLGISFLSGSGEKGKFSWKNVINAPFVATVTGLVLLLCRIRVPVVIYEATSALGDMIVPLSMMIIGGKLSSIPVKTVLLDWRIYIFSAIRLFCIPVIVWAVLRLFIHDPIVLGISTVLAAMPVASNATLLSVEYSDSDSQALASRGVFVTTVLSVATIPAVVYLLLI